MEKAKKMHALVEAYQSSGMHPKHFAVKHGISLYQLKYWIKKFKEEASSTSGFIRLTPQEITSKSSNAATHSLEIIYPNGVMLKLSAGDTSFLSQLISLY